MPSVRKKKIEGYKLNLDEFFLNETNEFLTKYNSDKRDSLRLVLFQRFQRNCKDYGDLIFRSNENLGDWKLLEGKPQQSILELECNNFFKIGQFWYKTSNGEIVHVDISAEYWIDKFKDGTYSKLSMNRIDACKFEILFIESTNAVNNGVSKKGDKYQYELLDKGEGYYLLSFVVPNRSSYYTFKMYLK